MMQELSTHNVVLMQRLHICVVVPTYNNVSTLASVVESVQNYCADVIVVNDGSTDDTLIALTPYQEKITLVSYSPNRGKGYALRRGFEEARNQGFVAAVTIDSDGQHKAQDIATLVNVYALEKNNIVMGCRYFGDSNMPKKNTFANCFSNFWFTMQTGIKLADTQTGFRLYPLQQMGSMNPFCHRYEAEIELLVRCAWRNIPIKSCDIHVYYPPLKERVSHFRPTQDFVRISILNAGLCVVALFYGYPSRVIRKWRQKLHTKDTIFNQDLTTKQ